MLIKGYNLSCRPATAEEGDTYIDLSTSKKYIMRYGAWMDPTEKPALPIATTTTAGVVSVGDGLAVTDAGVLSVAE